MTEHQFTTLINYIDFIIKQINQLIINTYIISVILFAILIVEMYK